jgi:multimeric flavodoxin WrbA
MNAVVLDASGRDDLRTQSAANALVTALEQRGAEVDRVLARELRVLPCTGCFGCWTRTPGQCVISDDARSVAERVIASDVYAIVSPVSFGSYGSLAKSVQDRLICLVLPHFTMVDGEVHHRPRYARYPVMLALGTLARPNEEQASLFARLVARNAINLHNPLHAVETVAGEDSPMAAAERLLDAAGVGSEVAA